MRELLRELPAPPAPPHAFGDVVPDPHDAFLRWFDEALAHGVQAPHEATLSTVDTDGSPDARMLILKDLDPAGWWFTSMRTSTKGHQLAANSRAALTFWWRDLGRQVRVRGAVSTAPPETSAAHFRRRSPGARAAALVGRQSEPLADPAALHAAVGEQRARLDAAPDLVSPDFVAYVLRADEVELWQFDPERLHERVRWRRSGADWTHTLLWP